MSDTPRTDAEAEIRCLPDQHDAQVEAVPASLARALERELADSARVHQMDDMALAAAQEALRQNTKYAVKLERAVEFGGYLAKSAQELLDACNTLNEARERHEDAEPGDEAAAAFDVMYAAEEDYSEAFSAVRNDIYEFEKRRDRAALAKNPNPSGCTCHRTPFDHWWDSWVGSDGDGPSMEPHRKHAEAAWKAARTVHSASNSKEKT